MVGVYCKPHSGEVRIDPWNCWPASSWPAGSSFFKTTKGGLHLSCTPEAVCWCPHSSAHVHGDTHPFTTEKGTLEHPLKTYEQPCSWPQTRALPALFIKPGKRILFTGCGNSFLIPCRNKIKVQWGASSASHHLGYTQTFSFPLENCLIVSGAQGKTDRTLPHSL